MTEDQPTGGAPAPRKPETPASVQSDRLRSIIVTASGHLDLGEMLQRLAGLVTEVTGGDVCFVHLLDHQRRRLVLSGATPPFDALAGTIELALGEGVAGWVAQHAQPAVVHDKWTDPRYKYIPELRGQDFVSFASVPMVARAGRVIGVLNVHSRYANQFSDEDVSILTGVANLMADAVENARLQAKLEEHEAELERFAGHTLQLQEAERQRLAAEIHDGISQRIVSLLYHLCAAADGAPGLSDEALAQINRARSLAEAALDEARAAIGGLRPPMLDDLGLIACLRGLVGELPSDIERDVDLATEPALDSQAETAIYRMAQEILQNVVKHAEARRVAVALYSDAGACTLSVADDGVGFDPATVARGEARPSYGLTGLRARAALVGGDVDVTSVPGRGTRVSIRVPLARSGQP